MPPTPSRPSPVLARRLSRPLRRIACLVAGVSALVLACGTAGAAEPSFDLDLELVSSYVFRGTVLNPDPCLQPAVTFSLGSLSATAWASVNLTDELGRAGQVGEVDLTVAWAGRLGTAEVEAGLNHYRYSTPEAGHTSELFADAVVPWPVELRLVLAWDLDAAGDLYARVALGLARELTDRLALDLEAGAAWAGAGMNDFNFGVRRASLAEGDVGATLELELDTVTLWLRAGASWLWHGDLERAAIDWYSDADPVFAGVGLSIRLTGP